MDWRMLLGAPPILAVLVGCGGRSTTPSEVAVEVRGQDGSTISLSLQGADGAVGDPVAMLAICPSSLWVVEVVEPLPAEGFRSLGLYVKFGTIELPPTEVDKPVALGQPPVGEVCTTAAVPVVFDPPVR
jgi:hypothetical protein